MPGYPSIELGFPETSARPATPVCPDNYSAQSSIECAGAHKLRVQVSAAGVVIQYGHGVGAQVWEPEQSLYPSIGTLVKAFDAVRVRNLIPGQAAQVILTPLP